MNSFKLIDKKLLKKCNFNEVERSKPEHLFECLPCQKKFALRPEDVISLDSIFSGLLDKIEPPEKEFVGLRFNVASKELKNEKQYMLFAENLFVSKLKNTLCKFDENSKIFVERELETIGEYWLNIEESYDGYIVFSKSSMMIEKSEQKAGHTLRGKYDDRFLLICEKRMEYDYVDNVRVEKIMEARNQDDKKLKVLRETKIGGETQRFKTNINIYGRTEVFLCDGGVMLLMRYLAINKIVGEHKYFIMNLFGKILSCVLTVDKEKQRIQLYDHTFDNCICIRNVHYFDNEPQETSESYYTSNGKLVLHFWHGFNYILHSYRSPPKPKERILPKLELMWRSDNTLLKRYQELKVLNYKNAVSYLTQHTEMVDFLNDYIRAIIKYKPDNVLEFSIRFFQNMRRTFE